MNINDLFEYRAGHSLPPDCIQLMNPDPVDVKGNPQAGDLAGPNAQFHENAELPVRLAAVIKKIAASNAAPEHKKAAIDALMAEYQKSKLEEESLQGIATSYDWQRYQNKEGQLRALLNQPRDYATQNYTGTPTEGPEDSEGPDLEPFYTQMKHPVSAGARFDKNFASPDADAQPVTEVDANSAAHESTVTLDLDLQDVVNRLRRQFDREKNPDVAAQDSQASTYVDLKVQMADPVSPGSTGLHNLGEPIDKMIQWEGPENNLNQNVRPTGDILAAGDMALARVHKIDEWIEEVYEDTTLLNEATAQSIYQGLQKVFPNLQSSSLFDLITQTVKPLIDMGVKGSRSAMLWIDTLYNFIRNTPDAKVGPQNYRALEQAALRNDPKGALEILAMPVKPNYRMAEARKNTVKQRNPVARAAQRVAKGSGTHKSKKSYQRQPKHRGKY